MKIFKGKKKGIIHTIDIDFRDIWEVFFPSNFHQKYKYLGSVPYNTNEQFEMIHMLVLAMDKVAKPIWCPRWFLRFLHLFGSDNSIVRVRNFTLYNLEKRITKGIMMVDYKYKWTDYDLRISIHAPEYLQDLADAIEKKVYEDGYREELLLRISGLDRSYNSQGDSIEKLELYLKQLLK